MNGSKDRLVNLGITVHLPARYWGKNRARSLKEHLLVYSSSFYKSLDLPISSSLDVVEAEQTDSVRNERVWIDLNGIALQVALPSATSREDIAGPGGLNEMVAHALCRGREYAVTGDVARTIWRAWFPGKDEPTDNSDSMHMFVGLITEAIRYGFSTTRFANHAGRLTSPDVDQFTAQSVFEDSIGDVQTTGACLYLSSLRFEEYESQTEESGSDIEDEKSIGEMLSMMSDGLFYELGLNYGISVAEDAALPDGYFRLQLNDMRLPLMSTLGPDEFLVNETADRVTLLQLEGKPAVNPANGTECAVLSDAANSRGICEQAGLTTWGPDGYMILNLCSEIRRNAGAFMTSAELYTDQLTGAFPALVNCARDAIGIQRLTRILRHLLDEEISIRDLRTILDGILSVDGVTTADDSQYILFSRNTGVKLPSATERSVSDLGADDYAACVRTVLKRFISYKYKRGGSTLVVYLMAPDIEDLIRKSNGALSHSDRDRIIDAVHAEIGSLLPSNQAPAILTTMDVRRRLRLLVEADFPALAVICYQELSPDTNIQPIARISFDS